MPIYPPGYGIISGKDPFFAGTTVTNFFIPSFNADAQAIIDAIEATDAGAQSEEIRAAINTDIIMMDADGTWAPQRAFYGFVGGTAAAHRINWRDPGGPYDITWNGTITHNANGWTGDGVSGYGDTNLPPSDFSANSLAFGFYSRTDSQGAACDINGGSGLNQEFQILVKFADGNCYSDNGSNGGTGRISFSMSGIATTGLFVSSRTASNFHGFYKNGTELGNTTGVQGMLNAPTFNIGCYNKLTTFTARNYALDFFSDGLTPTQILALTASNQALQTALGRNV